MKITKPVIQDPNTVLTAKAEQMLARAASLIMPGTSPAPAAFVIAGVIAARKAVDSDSEWTRTLLPIAIAALLAGPSILLTRIVMP